MEVLFVHCNTLSPLSAAESGTAGVYSGTVSLIRFPVAVNSPDLHCRHGRPMQCAPGKFCDQVWKPDATRRKGGLHERSPALESCRICDPAGSAVRYTVGRLGNTTESLRFARGLGAGDLRFVARARAVARGTRPSCKDRETRLPACDGSSGIRCRAQATQGPDATPRPRCGISRCGWGFWPAVSCWRLGLGAPGGRFPPFSCTARSVRRRMRGGTNAATAPPSGPIGSTRFSTTSVPS